ncbi:ovalbumin-related protein Y [Columba livia]|nr:ovalbumin-related protein Y [Columba livia]
MGSISAANAEFSFDVFKELKVQHANENIFYSPLSIIAALAMVYLGARGNTEYQMEKVLHFDKIAGLGGTIQTKIYLKCVKKLYRAGLEMVNFKTAPNQARQLINTWVENQTNGKIQGFLEPGSVDLDTVLVLVNAVYFKGIWKTAFKEEDTREFPFSVTKQETKPVQMMRQNSTFKVAAVTAEKIKILELPYASGELSMLVLLPDEISDLEKLENKISFEKLTEWTSPNVMERKRMKVYLPRMKMEEKYNLTFVLKALGMTDLFSPSASLSGISSQKALKISEAIHKAYMEVNEEGIEMADSAGVMGDIKHSFELEEFKADHPFLFLIKHNPTNSILFLDNTDFTMGSISVANAEFCFDVYKEVRVQHPNDNVFYSPLSIISALAMVYMGARGNTQSQMEKVLHFDNVTEVGDAIDSQCGSSEYIHNSLKDLLSDIARRNASYSLEIADKLYIEKTYPIVQEYLKCAKKFYRAELEEVNFKTAAEEAKQLINSWVEKESDGKIRNFLEPDSVDLNTVLVLVNAVYFKGIWKTAFKEEDTREFPFSVTKQETKPVQMMCQNSTFKVAEVTEEKIKILELPYASGELSMLVLLPDDVSDLEKLEDKISFEKLKEWTSPNVMERKRVKVYLPRMKMEEKIKLPAVLKALGMTDLFSPSADLSGISSQKSLKISEAIHKAYMEVNEEGTEATGSEEVTADIKRSSEFEEFKADRPFLFLIKHNPTDIILFFGNTGFTMASIGAASAEFSFEVFDELKAQYPNQNIIFAPLSILSALSMLYLGARGNTKAQIDKVVHFDKITGSGETVESQVQKQFHLLYVTFSWEQNLADKAAF